MGRPSKIIEETLAIQEDLNDLTVDKIKETAPKEEQAPLEMSAKEKAKLENAIYIEPKRKLSPFGTLPEKLKKEHAHDWEYVKGILENHIVSGEPMQFWYSKYPGDPDCLWEVPCNIPVYIPRMIAKHLETSLAYHTFDYRQRPDYEWKPDDFTHKFQVTGTKYRAKFRPMGAFA